MVVNKYTKPFEHVVIDNFLPSEQIKQIIQEADRIYAQGVIDANRHLNSKKFANHKYEDYEPAVRALLSELYAGSIKDEVEKLIGEKVDLDPDYNLGGGFHYLPAGGFLNMHVDFNIHPHLKQERIANAILYLNSDWKSEFGGQLVLQDKEGREETSYLPEANRLVIFPVRHDAYHGNPESIRGKHLRKSFAMYFYRKGKVSPEQKIISTQYRAYKSNIYYHVVHSSWRRIKKILPISLIERMKRD